MAISWHGILVWFNQTLELNPHQSMSLLGWTTTTPQAQLNAIAIVDHLENVEGTKKQGTKSRR